MGGKHSSQHILSKAKEKLRKPTSLGRRGLPGRGERSCATGVCAASSPTRVNSGPPLISFTPLRTRNSTTKSRVFFPVCVSETNNQHTADDVNEAYLSCILHALLVYYR